MFMRRILYWLRRESRAAALREEMDLHIEEKVAGLREAGLGEEDARATASRLFGNVLRKQEESREAWIPRYWSDLSQDLRYGARNLVRSRALLFSALLTLALGIGVNTSIFTLLYSVILRPVPVRAPETIVRLHQKFQGTFDRGVKGNVALLSYPEYQDYRERNQTLSGLAAYAPVELTLDGSRKPSVPALLVSCDYFSVLTVRMHLGRSTRSDECATPGANPVAVVTHGFWVRNLGADGGIAGRTISLNGTRFEVIGVTEQGFTGIEVDSSEVFVPITMHAVATMGRLDLSNRDLSWLSVAGRLKPDISIGQARANLSQIARAMDQNYPGRTTTLSVTRASLLGGPGAEAKAAVASIAALIVGALLLLIACANVANLLLARADRRKQEIGLRLALGATQCRIIRQLLSEAALLGILGGAVSLSVAYFLPDLIVRFGSGEDLRIDTSLDWAVFSYSFLISLAAGITFGLFPARQAVQCDVLSFLKAGGAPTHVGVSGFRFRNALVAFQLAVSLSAVIAATLLTRGIHKAQATDLGFSADRVLILTMDESQNAREIETRIRALPGIQTTGWAATLPMSGATFVSVTVDGRSQSLPAAEVRQSVVSVDYFATMGIPIIAGQALAGTRPGQAVIPAVVSMAMAKHFWQDESPLGRTFRSGEKRYLVSGIAKDIRSLEFNAEDGPLFYTPLEVPSTGSSVLLARMNHEAPAVATVLAFARSVAPGVEIAAERMKDSLKKSLRQSQAGATFTAILAVLALSLSAVGIYGVVNFAVTQQTREIGIRSALGATSLQTLELVIRQGMKPVLIGSAIGLLAAAGISVLMSNLLYGLSPVDPLSYLLAVLFQVMVALVAILIPAQRAARVDPIVALRGDQ